MYFLLCVASMEELKQAEEARAVLQKRAEEQAQEFEEKEQDWQFEKAKAEQYATEAAQEKVQLQTWTLHEFLNFDNVNILHCVSKVLGIRLLCAGNIICFAAY